jgi:hypothetical protein
MTAPEAVAAAEPVVSTRSTMRSAQQLAEDGGLPSRERQGRL